MVAAFGSNKSEENSNGSVHSQQLLELTASKIAPLLRSGEVSVVNYASVLLKQTAKHSSNLHAFITVDHEAVMAAARAADARCEQGEPLGSLFGIPISLKGLIITVGTTTTFWYGKIQ